MTTSSSQKRVCVIGAGLSGLAATKELVEAGVEVECYDMMPILGGAFAHYTWKGGQLTSSTISTWYSDFPVEDRQRFMTWREFVDYLGRYVDHFGFRERLNFNCKVEQVEELDEGWRIRFRRANYSNGHEFHPEALEVVEEVFEEHFTHLIMATGLHHVPKIPPIAGLEGFGGELMHSSEYRDASLYAGKRVVVVGGGESGSDIAAQVSAVAAEAYVSLRTAPGTLFPKWIQGNTPDIRDDRLTYNLPRTFEPVILRGHRRFYSIQTETPELFEWARDSNYGNKRCSFNSNACKSFGIPEAIVHHGASLRPAIESIEGSLVRFEDGSCAEVDIIIFATGFEIRFPMLDEALVAKLDCINTLWKNAVHPEIGEKLMIIGYARPHQINLITTSELQARMAALVISGARELPSTEAMRATIAADRAFMQRHYRDRYERSPALVDQLYFTDSLAEFIGCRVPHALAWRRDPKLGFMLTYGAISGAHHRLVGPGANWELAAKTIKATPRFNNRANARLRWSVLSVLTLYSWIAGRFNPDRQLIGARVRA